MVHIVAASFSPLQYFKAWSHLVLDREAWHPHTVIIPELTSPLSIELLRRWRGQKIPRRERQNCQGRICDICICIFKDANNRTYFTVFWITTSPKNKSNRLRHMDRSFQLCTQASFYVCKSLRIECQLMQDGVLHPFGNFKLQKHKWFLI